jgi:hypothetical protein
MHRTPACVLGVVLLMACGDGPTPPEGETGTGITFTAAGLGAFSANGTVDATDILARSFAFAFADSSQGLFAMGFSPTSGGVGDLLILQFPRQPGTYACGDALPCHGWFLSDLHLHQDPDGTTRWSGGRSFVVQSGSVEAIEVGPTILRGTFQVGMQSYVSTATLQITNGRIHVPYSSTPPPPGQSHRAIECLLKLAAGQQVTCS